MAAIDNGHLGLGPAVEHRKIGLQHGQIGIEILLGIIGFQSQGDGFTLDDLGSIEFRGHACSMQRHKPQQQQHQQDRQK